MIFFLNFMKLQEFKQLGHKFVSLCYDLCFDAFILNLLLWSLNWQVDIDIATHVVVEDDGPKRRFDSASS